jgi:hypothetical protein
MPEGGVMGLVPAARRELSRTINTQPPGPEGKIVP